MSLSGDLTFYLSIIRFNQQHDLIPFEMVDGHQLLHSGNVIHPPDPNTFCIDVWDILHWCLEHDIMFLIFQADVIYWQISFEIGQTSQNRMGFGSIGSQFHFPNAQLSQCGFVCNTIQSQTPIVCISSSGHSYLSDRRIVSELELSSCICISTNHSDTLCSSQDASISVQNNSYCSSLAPMSVVFTSVTSISISSNLSSALSRTADTVKRKVSTSKFPITRSSCLGVIKQSIRDKKVLAKHCSLCLKSKTNIYSESL